MKNIFKNYKDIIRAILILLVVCIIFTIANVLLREFIFSRDIANASNINIDEKIKNKDYQLINYEVLKKDIENTREMIEGSMQIASNDKSYMITFYEKAADIYNKKLDEIKEIITNKLYDYDSVNQLNYNIEKFQNDLLTNGENIFRVYPSSIDAKYELEKDRYEKIYDKCNAIIDEYRAILDK